VFVEQVKSVLLPDGPNEAEGLGRLSDLPVNDVVSF